MHPVSTVFLILGYALSLPIVYKLPEVIRQQKRLPIAGHQIGISLAILGWGLRSNIVIAAAHFIWILIVRLWFWYRGNKGTSDRSSVMT